MPRWATILLKILAGLFGVAGVLAVLALAAFLVVLYGFGHSGKPLKEEMTAADWKEAPTEPQRDSAAAARNGPAPGPADSLATASGNR